MESLAASNALQMWEMRSEISRQVVALASMPQSAPFAIAIANVEVITADTRNTIYEVGNLFFLRNNLLSIIYKL